MAIAAHVVFTGTDYSGRPGNYFVHALATGDAGAGLRPAAAGRTVGGRRCGRAPRPTGPNSRSCPGRRHAASSTARASRRSSTPERAGGVLPELLTAVGRAMAGERPVLLVEPRRDRERLVDRGRLLPAGRASGAAR